MSLNFTNAISLPDQLTLTPTVSKLSVSAACVLLAAYILRRRKSRVEQFPSPPADFFWGHLRRMPAEFQWKTFAEMGKTLGEHGSLT